MTFQRFKASVNGAEFFEVARAIGCDPRGPWLVGGSVRREMQGCPQDADFDVACTSADQLEFVRARLELHKWSVIRTHAAFVELGRGGLRIQLLRTRFYATVEAVLDSFDFTVCMTGYDGAEFVLGPHTKAHLDAKALVVNRLTYGPATLVRLIKYGRQGFSLSHEEARHIFQLAAAEPGVVDATMPYTAGSAR